MFFALISFIIGDFGNFLHRRRQTPAFAKLSTENRIIDFDWRHYNGKTHVVYRPRKITPDELMSGYEWTKMQFYSPGHIVKRWATSRTGLWWNIPRNLGYTFGLTSEIRARAAMHQSIEANVHANLPYSFKEEHL